MRRNRLTGMVLLGMLAILSTACDTNLQIDLDKLFGPSDYTPQASATVYDDSEFLPPGGPGRLPLARVRVDVTAGPQSGFYAFTDEAGRADLGRLSIGSYIRASKDGWTSDVAQMVTTNFSPVLALGQAPHTLWGVVVGLNNTGRVPGVLVRITSGPHIGAAALSDAAGMFRFDNLSTQTATFTLELSKAGLRTTSFTVTGLQRNTKLSDLVIQ